MATSVAATKAGAVTSYQPITGGSIPPIGSRAKRKVLSLWALLSAGVLLEESPVRQHPTGPWVPSELSLCSSARHWPGLAVSAHALATVPLHDGGQ